MSRPEALDRLLDRLPTPVYRLELTGRPRERAQLDRQWLLGAALRYHNPAFSRLHEREGQLLGRPLADLVPAGLVTEPGLLSAFSRTGELDLTLDLGAAGRVRPFRATWTAIEENGILTGIWGTLEEAPACDPASDTEIVGSSPAIKQVLQRVGLVAGTEATVLVTGETGTGKELVARAIHRQSPRAEGPLVVVNCGAISPNLVESELFGHEKGAFTGAAARSIGRFETADGGTLFLDEVGDLPLELQVKLLRVLQEGEFNRVGGREPVRVDVRVVAATHRDLKAGVRAGTFREDLYYRLNVFPIRTPPLRDRLEDLPDLVSCFVARSAARTGRPPLTVPAALLDAFARYPWPGNIRQLANLIERSVILSSGNVLEVTDWETGQYQPVSLPAAGAGTLEDMERAHIRAALERAAWKVSGPGGAAEILDLKPTTLEARMKRLGIARPR
ncbi:MAG: sigma-54 interaction domain-containing protein [Gemmatimonadales bacterium]